MCSRLTTNLCLALCFLLAGLSLSEPCLAQLSTADSFGTIRLRGRSSLLVKAEMTRQGFSMTSQLRVTIACTKGTSAEDRDLDVVLYLVSNYGSEPFSISKNVTLPQGSSKVTVDLPFQCNDYEVYWDVGVFEQGVDIEKKKKRATGEFPFQWHNIETGNAVGVGIIAGSSEKEASLQNMFKGLDLLPESLENDISNSVIANSPFGTIIRGNSGNNPLALRADIRPLDEITPQWHLLQEHPFWIISGATLQECKEKHPATFDAIRDYVASGGSICVQEVAFEQAKAEVDLLLARPEHFPDRWQPTSKVFSKQLWTTKHLMGQVYVCETRLDQLDQSYLRDQNLAMDQSINQLTHSSTDGNWFWRNIIRAVGKPPVWFFAAIVGLFGILLGRVYWY